MCVVALKLLSWTILCALVKAQQPDGYLGCFDMDSLINKTQISNNISYAGETCKAECKLQHKRYAGTMFGSLCTCGDDFQKNRFSFGCTWICMEKTTEMCGSSLTISLYDTWMCITGTCKNGATCKDINADHYKCICSDGWTGTLCNERVISSTSQSTKYVLSTNSSSLSTSTISSTLTISTHVKTTGQLFSQVDTKTTVSISEVGTTLENNTRLLDNLSATNGKTFASIYISVSAIIVVVVVGLIIFLIIRIRKLQYMKEDCGTVYKSSNRNSRDPSTENNVKYENTDTVQFDTPVYVNFNSGKMISKTGSLENEDNSYQYTSLNTNYISNRSSEHVYMKVDKCI